MNVHLLDVRNLSVSFHTDDGVFKAVDNVSLHVNSGEIIGLVGESGCGKSVTALSILKLIPSPPAKIESGQIYFNSHDLLKLDAADLRNIRGKAISMIFQEPLSALSPLQRIGQQLVEALTGEPTVLKTAYLAAVSLDIDSWADLATARGRLRYLLRP